jgi:hypothetical protein
VTPAVGKATARQWWNRLTIDLAPPIAAKEARTVTLSVRGTPAFFGYPVAASTRKFKQHRDARVSFDLMDFSETEVNGLASPVSAMLRGANLVPVPRYTRWTLEADPSRGESVIEDQVAPISRIEVDLTIPPALVGTDSCGVLARGHVQSRCSLPLTTYTVFAARLETEPLSPSATLAYFGPHRSLARIHAPSLSHALELARQTWPDLPTARSSVLAEQPHEPGTFYRGEWRQDWAIDSIMPLGALQLIPEEMFIRRKPIDANMVAIAVIANALAAQRKMAPEEQWLFERLLRQLASARLGLTHSSAVESGIGPAPPIQAILAPNSIGSDQRMRKVFAEIDHRVGSDRLADAVNEFVAGGPSPGTFRELLSRIGQHGGVSLDRLYTDYFLGTGIPKLTLANVVFRKNGDRWQVRGTLHNEGWGEALCPVILRTAFEPQRQILRVDTNGSADFEFTTSAKPRTIQLDPDGVCYRRAAVGMVDSVEYREGS